MALLPEDPNLGSGPDEDSSEISDTEDDGDADSVLSDDSVLPKYKRQEQRAGPATTLYAACARNEAVTLRQVLERGVTPVEVMELDINGRNGLMLAASKGFVDIISELHHCPFLDINHQDNDGNTALMIAAQAGFITIVTYILNYYTGLDLEVRDTRGFTALIKAAMQGREDCVTALVMAGANMNVVDSTRGKGVEDWALKTGRFETLQKLRRLALRPRAEQFCHTYIPQWPQLEELVARATATKSRGERLSQRLCSAFTFSFPRDPRDDGVLDHMVRMTTSIRSPLVATACHPLCPSSPPEMGKRRLAVPELLQMHSADELERYPVRHSLSSTSSLSSASSHSSASSINSEAPNRASLVSSGRCRLPQSIARRNSVFPSGCIPKIQVTKTGEATPKKEKKRKKKSNGYLEPPVWKYKEAKEEKKKKAEQEGSDKGKKKKEKK